MELTELITEAAELAHLPSESVSAESRLIEDLGLDSLALAELLAVLIEGHEAEVLDEQLLERSWEDVTLGELYVTYLQSGSAARTNGHGKEPQHRLAN